jgi:outer membrane protein OmpA-like peptidoglycan-associated protein
MRRSSVAAVLLLAGLAASGRAHAEPVGSYFYLAPVGGFTVFDDDYRFPGADPLENDLYVGGRLGYRFSHWLALEGASGFTPTAEDVLNGRGVDFLHASLDAVITPLSGRWGESFLMLGGGAGGFKRTDADVRDGHAQASLGVGANVWLTDVVGLRLEARDVAWMPRGEFGQIESHTMVVAGGLTFSLGAKGRDTDADQIPDRMDRCPATPSGAVVDATGCPLDTDQDKVFDGLDQCAATPAGAVVDPKGCPLDADGDGVFDGLDPCDGPRGAKVDARGCPTDGDGDGVFDGLDQCENTPKGATIDANGCPVDGDADGVADGLDRCPDTGPGLKVDRDGCPIEIVERETELLDTGRIRLSDVRFETGKAELLPESLPSLDVVGQVLGRWPELQIEIGGHTDARGGESANQRLSEARVQAVLAYLTSKFPDLRVGQFVAKGYGEGRPIASNTTPEGMTRNRRVEFVVLNKDVLRREGERRRLLRLDDAAPADTTKR